MEKGYRKRIVTVEERQAEKAIWVGVVMSAFGMALIAFSLIKYYLLSAP